MPYKSNPLVFAGLDYYQTGGGATAGVTESGNNTFTGINDFQNTNNIIVMITQQAVYQQSH